MATIPYGKLAKANNSVNEEYEKYYIFRSLERDLVLTLTEDEFEWI